MVVFGHRCARAYGLYSIENTRFIRWNEECTTAGWRDEVLYETDLLHDGAPAGWYDNGPSAGT
jgi:hypothetical protein